MARPKSETPKAARPTRTTAGLAELLVPLGVLIALVLPFFVFSVATSDTLRESKLLVQAGGAALVLAGLALSSRHVSVSSRGPRFAAALAGGALLFALISGVANAGRIDPLTAGAVLPPLALVFAGLSDQGAAARRRVFSLLMVSGAFTGALAAAQRFAGIFRLPIDAPQPRFFAAALIGSPGDVGAALVVPGALLWMTAADSGEAPRKRILAAAGFGFVLLGLGATESLAPFAALGTAAVAHLLFDLQARWKPFALAATLFVAAVALTGTGRRTLVKLEQLRQGQLGAAATQRDIGVLAAAEMARTHPFLGVGPGAFSNAFVPARIASEERVGRRLRHDSGSAHFENAHSEPLTLAAECGLPAAAFAVAAAAVTLIGLARRREDAPFTLLLAFSVLSVASFPLRLAVSCGPAAFLLGMAWRGPGRPGEKNLFLEGKSRAALASFAGAAGLVAILGGVRWTAVWNQAAGENNLRVAALLTGAERADLIAESRTFLRRSLGLRPRSATAWLALGSTYRIEQDFASAGDAYARSLFLEERAETDFNVGLCRLRLASPESARPFFLRAVWLLPRLTDSLPAEVDATAIEAEVSRAEHELPAGGKAPPEPRLPRR